MWPAHVSSSLGYDPTPRGDQLSARPTALSAAAARLEFALGLVWQWVCLEGLFGGGFVWQKSLFTTSGLEMAREISSH